MTEEYCYITCKYCNKKFHVNYEHELGFIDTNGYYLKNIPILRRDNNISADDVYCSFECAKNYFKLMKKVILKLRGFSCDGLNCKNFLPWDSDYIWVAQRYIRTGYGIDYRLGLWKYWDIGYPSDNRYFCSTDCAQYWLSLYHRQQQQQ